MAGIKIRFVVPGTRSYFVGGDVVGGTMQMEGVGSGGSGGTGTTYGGGGGKGGGYARRNAYAVTNGQELIFKVPAASAAGVAGEAATITLGSSTPPAVGTSQNSKTASFSSNINYANAVAQAFNLRRNNSSIAITYIGASQSTTINNAGNADPLPAGTQDGDLLVYAIGTGGVITDTDTTEIQNQGYTILASFPGQTAYDGYLVAYKFRSGDTTKPIVSTSTNKASVVSVYRNAQTPVLLDTLFGIGTTWSHAELPSRVGDMLVFVHAGGTQTGSGNLAARTFTATANATVAGYSNYYNTAGSYNYSAGVAYQEIIATAGGTSGTVVLAATGGGLGANGTLTAGGAGSTAVVGTAVGDVIFSGGNGATGGLAAVGAGGGGAGSAANGNNATTSTGGAAIAEYGGNGAGATNPATTPGNYGGAGRGAAGATARTGGAQGIIVLSYSTGVGMIQHLAQFDRKITAKRFSLSSIINTAIFSRKITVRRFFQSSIQHLSFDLKTIKLKRVSSIIHTARQTTKKVRLLRTTVITHTAFLRRAIKFTRVASIIHTPVFKRLVTLRRNFTASIQHKAKQFMKLEGRLIPTTGGGGTVINYFRSLFVFDD